MATYAIGDVQGCYDPLQKLLELIQFDPTLDTLWFTGDLVNRGPQSLATLRFVKELGKNQVTVLGNHDLHLLAVAHGTQPVRSTDTLTDILEAADKEELIDWLLHRPLLHHNEELQFILVHAGLAPAWDLATAKNLSSEVEQVLASDSANDFFQHMYGNQPDHWSNDLRGWDRLRCITNYLTRMRFCHADGRLELKNKGKLGEQANDLLPWFQVPNRMNSHLKIIFGHWAALSGTTHTPNVFALDTGCVWGNCLTAMRLEDEKRFSVGC